MIQDIRDKYLVSLRKKRNNSAIENKRQRVIALISQKENKQNIDWPPECENLSFDGKKISKLDHITKLKESCKSGNFDKIVLHLNFFYKKVSRGSKQEGTFSEFCRTGLVSYCCDLIKLLLFPGSFKTDNSFSENSANKILETKENKKISLLTTIFHTLSNICAGEDTDIMILKNCHYFEILLKSLQIPNEDILFLVKYLFY